MRIVSWNILGGGGTRHAGILAALRSWNPDVICLVEFRGTPSSQRISDELNSNGWGYQVSTVNRHQRKTNSLFIASRSPLGELRDQGAPVAHRFLATEIGLQGLTIGLMHIPNRDKKAQEKYDFHDFILGWTKSRDCGATIVLGDTNTGEPGIDEEGSYFNRREGNWMRALRESGWQDAWRIVNGDQRAYSWRAGSSGNGFRIDQAFMNDAARLRLKGIAYEWGPRCSNTKLSDHAAMILDLHEGPRVD